AYRPPAGDRSAPPGSSARSLAPAAPPPAASADRLRALQPVPPSPPGCEPSPPGRTGCPASPASASRAPARGLARAAPPAARPRRILARHVEEREQWGQQGLEGAVQAQHPPQHLGAHLPVVVPVADLEVAL